MKKLSTVFIVLGALIAAAPAFAADMALKAPPPVAPWYDWTGFYVGINGGYSWGRSATNYTGTAGVGFVPFSTSRSMDGGLGGGQIGYNWQPSHNWVFGVEADIQGTGQRGTATLPPVTTIIAGVAVTTLTTTGTLAQKLPWFGTARLRLGYEPTDHGLLYVTGGLAFGEVDSTASTTLVVVTPGGTAAANASTSANTTKAGWTIGAGAEWVLSSRWTAKVEYLYMDLGNVNNTFAGVGAFTVLGTSSHITDNIARVGLNYRFGGSQ